MPHLSSAQCLRQGLCLRSWQLLCRMLQQVCHGLELLRWRLCQLCLHPRSRLRLQMQSAQRSCMCLICQTQSIAGMQAVIEVTGSSRTCAAEQGSVAGAEWQDWQTGWGQGQTCAVPRACAVGSVCAAGSCWAGCFIRSAVLFRPCCASLPVPVCTCTQHGNVSRSCLGSCLPRCFHPAGLDRHAWK